MPRRRPALSLTTALVLLVLTVGCASEPSDEERAAARRALLESAGIVESTADEADGTVPDTTSGGVTSDPSRSPASPAPSDRDAVIAAVPDEGLRFQATVALAAADRADAACGELSAWAAAMDEATGLVRTFTDSVVESGNDWVGSTGATDVAGAFRDQLILQADCRAGAEDGDIDAALAAAGAASAANDELRVALTGDDVRTASEFWYHADQIGHAVELARLSRSGDPVDILIIGSSTGKRGFDPNTLTSELGRSTMNASVAGMVPSVFAPWLVEAVQLGGAPSTIIIALNPWQDLLPAGQPPCDATPEGIMADAQAMKARAFARIAALARQPAALRLTGGPAATYDGVAIDISELYQPGQRGWAETDDTVHGPGGELAERYEAQLSGSEGCARYREVMAGVVAELTQGTEVLLVSLPIHPAMTALIDGGAEAHRAVSDDYAAIADQTGAGWLDLTDLLSPEEFLDLTDANGSGQVKITEATVEALR
ncbi:MAG: hypothetical protein OEW42_12300 [Acidimicrobiia bacterium]|nr:hypothetical protein [Acidimicrobiia bacterium]